MATPYVQLHFQCKTVDTWCILGEREGETEREREGERSCGYMQAITSHNRTFCPLQSLQSTCHCFGRFCCISSLWPTALGYASLIEQSLSLISGARTRLTKKSMIISRSTEAQDSLCMYITIQALCIDNILCTKILLQLILILWISWKGYWSLIITIATAIILLLLLSGTIILCSITASLQALKEDYQWK